MHRSAFISAVGGALAASFSPSAAQSLTTLDVAYAGSMGSMMEGPVKTGAAQALAVDMHGRAQGSDALAQLIVGGSIAPDVFIPVTPGPAQTVLRAGKAASAVPLARTEMVIAYSPKSKFAPQLADAAAKKPGALPWYRVLAQPGFRFGRTDPATDPQGRNIIFTLQLAEKYYRERGLADAILHSTTDPSQIFSEPTVEARLQSGELDAASAYKIQPGPFGLPFLSLPDDINLGNASMRDRYAEVSLQLGTKTYRPQALVYYTMILKDAAHPQQASAFVRWLLGDVGRTIFQRYAYDPPVGAVALAS